MKVLSEGPRPRADRPASELQHDEASARVVAFRLEPGQVIAPHRSDSTVIVQVTDGAGTFIGADGSALLGPGEAAIYAPGEVHAIEAGAVPLRFLAILTPAPGA